MMNAGTTHHHPGGRGKGGQARQVCVGGEGRSTAITLISSGAHKEKEHLTPYRIVVVQADKPTRDNIALNIKYCILKSFPTTIIIWRYLVKPPGQQHS